METLDSAMAYSDALRGYIVELRTQQGVSQKTLAEAMGIARNTYIAWETGETKDIKTPLVVRAIKYLGGLLDHLALLESAEEQGRTVAREWLALSPEERQQLARVESKLRRVIELSDKDPDRLEQVIERLRSDARADPAILDLVMAYIDGRRSGRNQQG